MVGPYQQLAGFSSYQPNKWYEDTSVRQISARNSKDRSRYYEAGFHAYTTREQARDWLKRTNKFSFVSNDQWIVIRKVKLQCMHTLGVQSVFSVFVAKRMLILKDKV